jgi:heterodisulfide reductase subunit B
MKELSYYPGCSLHGTAREYGESIKGVSDLLGIRLHELENWTCCGASSAHCTDEKLALALPALNLAMAERSDRELLVPCVACYHRFKVTEKEVKEHPDLLPSSYRGKVPIRYALDFFSQEEWLAELKAKTVKPLDSLKVVCYYGCLPVRPPKLTSVKAYENPTHMDRLMEALGAQSILWSYKTDCCGASLVVTRTDIVRKLVGRLLAMALEAEADCIVTGCSMCQSNLDTRQDEIKADGGGRYAIPVLYFTELMGLALGHKEVKKWLGRHVTSPFEMLRKKGLL